MFGFSSIKSDANSAATSVNWQRIDGRIMFDPMKGFIPRDQVQPQGVPVDKKSKKSCAKAKAKAKRCPVWKNFSIAANSKRKTHKGVCILFNGVRYQTLPSFAKDHGFDSGGGRNVKMAWYKEQLSGCPLKNCLRFLSSESLKLISRRVPKIIREGLVDARDLADVFCPATRRKKTGNAGLYKLTVLDENAATFAFLLSKTYTHICICKIL